MQPKKLTYSDYARIPDDGKRYEVLEGGLLVTPAPNIPHQRASKRLLRQLEDYFEPRGLGEVFDAPVDVILSDHDIVQPDLVVAPPERISKRAIEGPPMLVVEILSPSTERTDRISKGRRYAALGVPHYWLADPDRRTLECWRKEGEAYALVVRGAEGALAHPDWPGLVLDLDALFR
jgi:Uma2 family endonuclease